MDHLNREKRSWNMSRIRSVNTKPELMVRSYFHKKGLRFRVHNKIIAGKPDIYLKKYKTVVFVHGCFWHRHFGCRRATFPKSNTAYWEKKFSKNLERDSTIKDKLETLGFNVVIVWECQAADSELLNKIIDQIKGRIESQ